MPAICLAKLGIQSGVPLYGTVKLRRCPALLLFWPLERNTGRHHDWATGAWSTIGFGIELESLGDHKELPLHLEHVARA